MNPAFLGDSFDLVKRFFAAELRSLGYEVAVDPLFTGNWAGEEETFLRLIGAIHRQDLSGSAERTALFLDPDTGVKETGARTHVSFKRIADESATHEIVFAFDQSFSRKGAVAEAIARKLLELSKLGLTGLYYDSHARFLFASRRANAITELRLHLHAIGIPSRRLITINA